MQVGFILLKFESNVAGYGAYNSGTLTITPLEG